MKKIVAIGIALFMVAMTSAPMISAGESDSISVTMEPNASADIIINNQTWDVSAGLEGTETFDYNLTNNGSVQVDVNVSIPTTTTNDDGGSDTWGFQNMDELPTGEYTLHDLIGIESAHLTPGTLYYEGSYERVFELDLPPSGQSGNVVEDTLTLTMPDSTSTNDTQSFDISFVATVD